ncbi:MAG TPA: tetratricopeptide repeat protein [Vicinamibacterales bacterium]|nr:tetratricopeptide repeat protein [Vicinamibacterales bacterium]
MHTRRPTFAVLLAICLPFVCASAHAQTARELRDRASDLTYNLDYDEAIKLLRQATSTYPNDAASHRALASTIWLDILFKRGAVTVDHYLGSFTGANVDVRNPPADLDAEFKREVAKAIELGEKRVAASPRDPQALFELSTSVGLQASYTASVEGKLMAGFRAARRSYDTAETVLTMDPKRKEAGLVVGTYRYLVSTLSLPMRVMAYVAGFGGGKERGLKMIEETVAAGAENRTDAEFALILLYNRERRYEDAMRVMRSLRRQYPRNRLVLLEAGATAVRASRADEAEKLLSEGIALLARDTRAKFPGEDALWHYKRGAARVMLGRRDDALADLRLALTPGPAGWVQGRSHLELARLAAQRGDRDGARREALEAIAVCERNKDPICAEDARKIK